MITLRNITLRRGTKVVLDDASVTLQPGEKVGLVGRNGAGKSSLFALLTDRLHSDKGEVEIPRQWAVGEVAQNMPETDMPATDFVLEGDTRLMAAREALAQAEAADDGHAIAEAHALLMDAGAFDAPARAQALLMGLGFKGAQVDAPVNSFSGGWRMRLQLARALMCPADLMLLDEPTNHLDLDALVWLEAWLQRYEGTLIVISHDREFLDAITKVTLHLDEAKLHRYGGNYTAFEAMRAERMVLQQAAFEKQQDRVAHLQKFIDRFKAKASKAKQAQSRVKALERMERLAPVLTSADFSFSFREPLSLPNPMLMFDQVSVGYLTPGAPEGDEKVIVRGVDRSVLAGQRFGILGANGQGKSTLVKTIARMQPSLGGTITEGKGLSIGYFAQQEMDVLRPDEGPLQHMVRLAKEVSPSAREQELRDFLGQFRFVGDMVNQAVGSLSGGEKARLVLAMLVWQRPNLLLLDEPTNHLDLQTREALSMALNEFEGTVMLVSHDRALLREVCDEFWLVAEGKVAPFDGDLDDYQRWLLEQSKEAARQAKELAKRDKAAAAGSAGSAAGGSSASAAGSGAASGASGAPGGAGASNGSGASGSTAGAGFGGAGSGVVAPVAAPVAAPAPIASREDRKAAGQARQRVAEQTRPLRKEMEQIDARLKALHAEREGLESQLSSGTLSPAQIAEAGKRLKAIGDEVDEKEMRWLELSEQVDALQAS
ncbi:ABC-F family ATP-binding cassette domain-containing protein [Roseateles depolymerans]|uniref:Probable ATP-binding protein YheS n=1 Tax=Roseateles depolymerans TaxID=76731 RepID=A0A0U3L694_9BURK|nr:ATP-binding cassette domain-containing protein [Roseateles depolymerans]ALV06782.1 ABC transporter-like protein [Roseateles depolymerans]REG19760.1 ATP-binding cassette subfamily F protein 3 [Roseateles depolymerans]